MSRFFSVSDVVIGALIAVAVVWAFRSGGRRTLCLAGLGAIALVEAAVLISWAGGKNEGNLIVTLAAATILALAMTLCVPVLARLTKTPALQIVGVLLCGAIGLFGAAMVAFAGHGL